MPTNFYTRKQDVRYIIQFAMIIANIPSSSRHFQGIHIHFRSLQRSLTKRHRTFQVLPFSFDLDV